MSGYMTEADARRSERQRIAEMLRTNGTNLIRGCTTPQQVVDVLVLVLTLASQS